MSYQCKTRWLCHFFVEWNNCSDDSSIEACLSQSKHPSIIMTVFQKPFQWDISAAHSLLHAYVSASTDRGNENEMQSILYTLHTSISGISASTFVLLKTKSMMPQILERSCTSILNNLTLHVLWSTENIKEDSGCGECAKTKWLHWELCDAKKSPAAQFITYRVQLHAHHHRSKRNTKDPCTSFFMADSDLISLGTPKS